MAEQLYISGLGYHVPEQRVPIDELWQADLPRIKELNAQFQRPLDLTELDTYGVRSVPVAAGESALKLASRSVADALSYAGIAPTELDLIIDYSAVRAPNGPLGPRLQGELAAFKALSFGLNCGGCAAFHLALQLAQNSLLAQPDATHALLFAGDKVPERSRICFPLGILGDGGSAAVLSKQPGPYCLAGVAVKTVGLFHRAVGLPTGENRPIPVDIEQFESRLLPAHFKAIHDVIHQALTAAKLTAPQIDHVIFENISKQDRSGFQRAFKQYADKLYANDFSDLGHILATDMVINLVCLERSGQLQRGQNVLLVSSGAGFYWGATVLARR